MTIKGTLSSFDIINNRSLNIEGLINYKNQKGGKRTMCEALEELITEAKNEGRKEGEDIGEKRGEERGKLIGEERGEIKKLMKLLLKKFPNKNFEWVKECSKTQLEKIDDYIFLNISYSDFYKLVHS